MSDTGKPILISHHASQRMRDRGATQAEVEHAIRTVPWQPAKRGKWRVKERRTFDSLSPVNNQRYAFKVVEVVFADAPRVIVVVTVKVFYYN